MFPKTMKKEPEIVIELSESDNDSIEYYEINNKKKENKIKKEKNEKIISIKLDKYKSDEKFINAEDLNDSINNNNELINKKRERQNKKKIKVGLEFKLFYKLVDKYGIDKVLSSLCNNDNKYSRNTLDQYIDKINDTCGKDKFIINIMKTYFFLLKEYLNENPDTKIDFSDKNNNLNQQRISFNKKNEDNYLNILPNFEFNKNNMIEIPLKKEEIKQKNIKLESHYKKNEDGNIYKYKVMYLMEKMAIFKCFDDDCNGDGYFDIDTEKFKIEQKHNKKYSDHDFIKNKENDYVLNEMNNKKYIDAQIFLEGNDKVVKYYS